MQLEQQVVSLELARILQELGVRQESYFSWLWIPDAEEYTVSDNSYTDPEWIFQASAFTVAELGEMLPAFASTFRGEKEWSIEYEVEADADYIPYVQFSASTEAGARAKMLIHLLKTNLIDPKNL